MAAGFFPVIGTALLGAAGTLGAVAFQAAALSSAPLTLFVTFGARDGAPPSLMLAIERRTT